MGRLFSDLVRRGQRSDMTAFLLLCAFVCVDVSGLEINCVHVTGCDCVGANENQSPTTSSRISILPNAGAYRQVMQVNPCNLRPVIP